MLGWNLSGICDVSPPIDPKNGQKIFFGSRGKFWSELHFRQRSPDQWLHYPSRNLWKKRPQVHDFWGYFPKSVKNLWKKDHFWGFFQKSVKNLWKNLWKSEKIRRITGLRTPDQKNLWFLSQIFLIMSQNRLIRSQNRVIRDKITSSTDQIHLANGGSYYCIVVL